MIIGYLTHSDFADLSEFWLQQLNQAASGSRTL
jgi:hypothetical protein